MAHLRLFMLRELGERSAERRIVEERIVAEAAAPARRGEDHALDHALHDTLGPRGIDQGDDAAKSGAAARLLHAIERGEQARAAAGVVQARAAEARRAQAGGAADLVRSMRDGDRY